MAMQGTSMATGEGPCLQPALEVTMDPYTELLDNTFYLFQSEATVYQLVSHLIRYSESVRIVAFCEMRFFFLKTYVEKYVTIHVLDDSFRV